MPKNNESSFSKYFNLPNQGLRSYFDIVEKGKPDVITTPWISSNLPNSTKLKKLQKILAEWMPHLDKLQDSWPTLLDFEKDLAAKVGPLSVELPLKDRMDDIDAYYEDVLRPAAPISDVALKATLSKFARAKGLTPRAQKRTVDLMKKSTNSGSPYFTKRRNVVDKTTPCSVLFPMQYLSHGEWNVCAVLGWRGQEGGPTVDDTKQRVVWMFPFAVNICELQVYQPMIEVFQHFNLIPAWVSMESVDQSITRLFDTKGADDPVICTDFSKFDQHFNAEMQKGAKTILSGILDNSSASHDWLDSVFPIKYEIPLAYDYGKIRSGKHGMGSGSGGTNADETLAHTALQFEAAINNNAKLNPNSMCLGDDGVLTYPGITAKDVMRSYTAHGLEMNESKQYVSTQDCVYLRRWHHKNYRVNGVCAGVYSTARALGRLCMQERFYDPDEWGAKMVALRELSILENVKYHPLRDEFADFCMERDKFRLGKDIPGFLDNIESEARKATDLMPDFLGYTKSMSKQASTGISEWWIVKYLKSK